MQKEMSFNKNILIIMVVEEWVSVVVLGIILTIIIINTNEQVVTVMISMVIK